jgi:Flp pilus assembly protein TadD
MLLSIARPAQCRKTPPEQRWWKAEHQDFTVFCNIGPMATEKYAKRLNDIAAGIATVVPRSDLRDGKPLHLFVVRDDEDFKYLGAQTSANASGYYRPESFAHLLVVNASAADAHHVLNHEFVHAYFVPRLPEEPRWLHEGLAEYYSVIEVRSGQARLGKSIPHHIEALERLPPMDYLYMTHLSTKQFFEMGPKRRAVFYAQAWALTHYLFEGGRSHPQSMGEFLQGLASGQTLTASFASAYRMSRQDIDREFRRYVDRAYYADRRVDLPGEYAADWKPRAEEMSRDEVLLRISELGLASRAAREQTLPLLRELITLDADTHEGARLLGVCLVRSDSTAEAIEWFEKAIELHPNDGLLHGLLGLWLLRRRPGADAVERGCAHLRTAAMRIPGNVEVQVSLAKALRVIGEMDSAFVAYEAALSVHPWMVRVTEEYIDARAQVGQLREARSILDDRLMPFATEHCIMRVESRLALHYEARFDEVLRDEGEAGAKAFMVEAIQATHSPDVRARLAQILQRLKR